MATAPLTQASSPPSPWGAVSTNATAAKPPTLQEILDEELAKQLMEMEIREAQANAAATDDAFEQFDLPTEEDYAQDAAGADEEDDFDAYDDDDEFDDEGQYFPTKGSRRGGGGGRQAQDKLPFGLKLSLSSDFDKRTLYVFSRLVRRYKIDGVDKRLHSSPLSLLHHAVGPIQDADGNELPGIAHYAVKILKAPSGDYTMRTTESLLTSGRPMNAAMVEKTVRRHLQTKIDHEYSALSRAIACGVRAPVPICHFEHVLITQFLGDEDGCVAPTLHDVSLTSGQLVQIYVELLVFMRKLYREAKLVHGELNEFNILYRKEACWLIDFAHAVNTAQSEHEEALERDIQSVRSIFERHGMVKASKHRIGLLHEATMKELVMAEAPAKVLNAYPCFKPYFYNSQQ
ncbi:hypothetical protein Poli38472_013549 [Pythium oligandrum]|uniref:non-specific serine/threonine protein kinase n=1 Tax=Pythium oligandrum TaxID=41045 RepID=A0A8K1C7V5_PYTOL|nr:hypothetical protein Poli38472_013549 [Pythium oligandrum]|eukprot:TMW58075.1 hypothetical protein Poli38472_013549 [Pythium oligandrum]